MVVSNMQLEVAYYRWQKGREILYELCDLPEELFGLRHRVSGVLIPRSEHNRPREPSNKSRAELGRVIFCAAPLDPPKSIEKRLLAGY